MPSAAPSAAASAAAPEPPAVEWARFNGPADAVLDATRITLRVEGKKSYTVAIEHDGNVSFTSGGACGVRTIQTGTIGSLLAFIRTNEFFALQPTYKAEGAPTSQDEVRVDVRTPANDVLVVAERGSKPPKALLNIANAIETITAVDSYLPKLKTSALTQEEVERALHRDKARLAKCKKAASFAVSVDKLGATALEGVIPAEEGPCVGPIVAGWKFGPTCGASVANVMMEKSGATVAVAPAHPL